MEILEVLGLCESGIQLKLPPVTAVMSANEHTEMVFECINGGAEDYLLKPVTKKEVQHIWQHVWRRQQLPNVPNSQVEPLEVGLESCFCHRKPCLGVL